MDSFSILLALSPELTRSKCDGAHRTTEQNLSQLSREVLSFTSPLRARLHAPDQPEKGGYYISHAAFLLILLVAMYLDNIDPEHERSLGYTGCRALGKEMHLKGHWQRHRLM